MVEFACDAEFGPHEHDPDMECEQTALDIQNSAAWSYDPMMDIPWGTPDSWIPDNPDENGMRWSDFVELG